MGTLPSKETREDTKSKCHTPPMPEMILPLCYTDSAIQALQSDCLGSKPIFSLPSYSSLFAPQYSHLWASLVAWTVKNPSLVLASAAHTLKLERYRED